MAVQGIIRLPQRARGAASINDMPRTPRCFVAGQTLHLVQRGNNRSACFVDDADRIVYLGMLTELAGETRCAIHAYVLMSNHVHLLVTPELTNAPSSLMQRIGMRFAAYVSRKYRRSGTLWEGRFRSSLVESDDYVIACHRYIELNPVRAGIVARPEQYRWSSHLANIGAGTRGFLRPHPSVSALGRHAETARLAYCALFDTPLDGAVVGLLRHGMGGGCAELNPGSDSNLTPVFGLNQR